MSGRLKLKMLEWSKEEKLENLEESIRILTELIGSMAETLLDYSEELAELLGDDEE